MLSSDVPPASQEPMWSCVEKGQARPDALKILVAEDHPAIRMVLDVILKPLGTVVFAENGQQAVEAVRQETFDIILMDMHMPLLDGVAATRQIRADEADAGRVPTPLLILTANDLDEYVEMGRTAGADGHLVKPVSSDALHDIVLRTVRR